MLLSLSLSISNILLGRGERTFFFDNFNRPDEDLADSPNWTWDGNGDEDSARIVSNQLQHALEPVAGYLAPALSSSDQS